MAKAWEKNKADQSVERKWKWFLTLKENFKGALAQYEYHVEQYGPPGCHPYVTRGDPNGGGCPLVGRQCPIRANMNPSYDSDYGYPEGGVYVASTITKAPEAEDQGARAQRESEELVKGKRANDRSDDLKRYYRKGNVLEVSKANGRCEVMDDAMDNMESRRMAWIEEWIKNGTLDGSNVDGPGQKRELAEVERTLRGLRREVLDIAKGSGMRLSGAKKGAKGNNSEDPPDSRSGIELGLCEDVCDWASEFLNDIEDRIRLIGAGSDPLTRSSIGALRELLGELHMRNMESLSHLGEGKRRRPLPTRSCKSREAMVREAKKKLASETVRTQPLRPLGGGGGKGGFLDEIAGRGGGRGRGDRSPAGGGGRGGFLDEIAGRGGGRGRGGEGRSPFGGGGRGGFLDEIAGRGEGSDFLDEITGRDGGGEGRTAGES